MRIKSFISIYFFFLSLGFLFGQQQELEFDSLNLESYRNKKDFQYVESKVERSTTDLSWINSFFEFLASPAGIVTIVLILGVLIYLTAKQSRLKKTNKSLTVNLETARLKTADSSELHKQYMAYKKDGDFGISLRYLFLHLLKELDKMGKIDLHPDKTNRQYIQELKTQVDRQDFKKYSRLFELITYGHRLGNEEMLAKAEEYYQKLIQSTDA